MGVQESMAQSNINMVQSKEEGRNTNIVHTCPPGDSDRVAIFIGDNRRRGGVQGLGPGPLDGQGLAPRPVFLAPGVLELAPVLVRGLACVFVRGLGAVVVWPLVLPLPLL